MGSTRAKLPSYLLPNSVSFDPGSGELYVVKNVYRSNDDIVERLSRKTESSSSKLYKWQRSKSPWRKAVIINKNPNFDAVSKEKAQNIAERLSRPTHSTRFRGGVSDNDSETGSVDRARVRSYSAASRASSIASRASTIRLPRPSARPDKPILIHPSARREKFDSPSRAVRFQDEHVQHSPRGKPVSAGSHKSDVIPPIRKTQNTDQKTNHIESSVRSDTVFARINSSNPESKHQDSNKQVGKPVSAKHSASQNRKQTHDTQHSLPENNDTDVSKSNSKENKNMELVFDYFSKLPGIED